ncbi:GNAT family N-acetyltransferase [Solitalea koreensis]|uniref:Phosphinothricin acetyltransferase n=1 Tax=Solitalea koreensis TaxID=543615 RepID=A0A521CJL6_9SPHI|nr:GNAT family N-acetyltransferase [Solitalea koreensis]SMO59647.1 phosphinothricin acetyltransferase [Solitalea koreensis]
MINSDILIRPATENDLPEILAIYNDAIINTTAVYNYTPHTLAMRKEWFEQKMIDRLPVFVAECTHEVIGFSTYGPFRAWAAYKYSIESSVYISPEHRGQGIGKLLIPPLIAEARHKQLHTIVAGIDASNIASIKLHQNFGFSEVGRFKQVGYKFGKWLDLVFLQLILDTPEHPTET